MKDIKILENYIKGKDTMKESLVKAIENLIKENQAYEDRIKELEEDRDTLRDLYWNCCIPKSFVKEKLEELDKQEKTELKGMKGQDRYAVKLEYQNKRSVLQELLGEDYD